MEATIQFKSGKTINVEVNGNCYIKSKKPSFPDDLSVVTVTNGDGTQQVFENARLIECAAVDGKYWFSFLSETEQEKTIRELREENELLEGAIAELAEIIGKGE